MRYPYAKTGSGRNTFCLLSRKDCTYACFPVVCLGFFIAVIDFFWQHKIRAGVPDTKAIHVSQGFCLGAFSVPLAAPRWYGTNTVPTKVVTFSSSSQAARFVSAMESQAAPAATAGNSTSTGQQLLLEFLNPNDWLSSMCYTRKDDMMR